MAPDLVDSYSKNLNVKPYSTSEQEVDKFYHLSADGDLLEVVEFILNGGDYDFYIEIYKAGCTDPDFFREQALEKLNDGDTEDLIIDYLLSLDMLDDSEGELVGRIAYNEFTFKKGSEIKSGKQIKAAFIADDYRSGGLGRSIYKRLVYKHEHIICDNIQSVAGGTLWASGIITLAGVDVYDTRNECIIGVLGDNFLATNGMKPWSAINIKSVQSLDRWDANSLAEESRHHIVNILSRENLFSY
ncbi:TPA: hypothetical protein SMV40_002114 [Proteus mirabilis]|uniref:hypothetical protein n=1 Tax=Proteus mirabilis TaxID=584 RepID=UPI0023B29880|nr:hypothetical protein [Proteus mirabilis]HEK3119613.1 hypothetical protein [Proteus mirabilis]